MRYRRYYPPKPPAAPEPVISPAKLRFFKQREAAAHRQAHQYHRWAHCGLSHIPTRLEIIPDRQAVVEAVRVQQNRLTRLGVY